MAFRSSVLILMSLLTLSCGSSNHLTSSAVGGAYEFAVTSNVTGGVTLIEANLSVAGNQSVATGPNQVQILTLQNKIWYVNGVCPGSDPGRNDVTANVGGSNVALTFNEGGNTLPAQGVLTGTTITGNYSVSGSSCAALQGQTGYPAGFDSGGVVGNQVPSLSGTFSGTLSLPNGTDNAAFTLTENSDHTLTVSALLRGNGDNGTFTFTGAGIGNVMFATGSVNGTPLHLFGYFDRAGTYTKMPNSLLVFNYDTQTSSGLLLGE